MTDTILQSKGDTGECEDVLHVADIDLRSLTSLLSRYGLVLKPVKPGGEIPGSFWGDSEAGLIGSELLVRDDTPLHSLLHEACHYICMDHGRRQGVHTNAGGDYDEENAVCYLQVLLADHVEQFGRQRMLKDMDRWGYTFRLGSAQAWFEKDADDALAYLLRLDLVDARQRPTFQLRQ